MTDGVHDESREPPTMARRRHRPFRKLVLAVVGAGIVGLAVGFVAFAEMVLRSTPPADPHADGIVVLTGGTARIDGALGLLAEGRADRLLISGVNPSVSRDTIASVVGEAFRPQLDCCVDIDHARDTIENARSTGQWTDEFAFSSLIVVTSGYHMPRSLAELRHAMPGVTLIAYPVATPDLDPERWWRDPAALTLLAREYGKYLVAEARLLLPAAGGASAAGR